jgi:hypothetical protein
MKSSDLNKLTKIYEDIGAGVSGGSNSDVVMGVNMPDSNAKQTNKPETTKPQAIAFVREIKKILLDLNEANLDSQILSKLAIMTDRINSIDNWLQNNLI